MLVHHPRDLVAGQPARRRRAGEPEARDASKPGWWHSYDDVLPSWFRVAVGLEESARLIRAYEAEVVPGLLQTEGYIRAITAASFPAASGEFTERAVALRLARQQLLARPEHTMTILREIVKET